MRLLTGTEVQAFIAAKPAAAIHLDAEWDTNYRTIVRHKMEEAEQALGDQVNFGEVDCDLVPELARSVPVLNVPSVAYYRKGKLIAVLVGTGARRARWCGAHIARRDNRGRWQNNPRPGQ